MRKSRSSSYTCRRISIVWTHMTLKMEEISEDAVGRDGPAEFKGGPVSDQREYCLVNNGTGGTFLPRASSQD